MNTIYLPINCPHCKKKVSESDFKKVEIEEVPKLVGHTNRPMGYKGYKPIEVGTPIYLFKGFYQITMIQESNGSEFTQKFYADERFTAINFIPNETKS